MSRKIGRDSTDGRFISQAEARRRPTSATVETVDSAFVSPAMALAGTAVLIEWMIEHPDSLPDSEDDIACEIYRAMWKARP